MKKKNEGAENKVFFIDWQKENSSGENMTTHMKGVKTKRLHIHFKSFKLEQLSSRRAHIFFKASISWSLRIGADLTFSSCSSRTCTTSSCSTWWDSIRGNDCSNWASSVHRSATLNLIVWISAVKDIVLWDASARRSSILAPRWIRGLFGLSLFILKLKTETENTVVKYFLNGWIVPWDPFLIKKLLKSGICGSVNSARMQCSRE